MSDFIERARKKVAPEDARQSRSNAMITLGVVLLAALALFSVAGSGSPVGGIVFGVLAAGLIVGGLVIRH